MTWLLAAAPTTPAAWSFYGFTIVRTTDFGVVLLALVTTVLVAGTVALAIYTARLHAATVALAGDTVAATKLSDRHHQESLAPVCVLSEVEYSLQPPRFGKILIKIAFRVENQGGGPAVAVSVRIAPKSSAPSPHASSLSQALLPLKAGANSHVITPHLYEFGEADEGFDVTIEFESVFGTKGRSEWHLSQSATSALRELQLPLPQDRV